MLGATVNQESTFFAFVHLCVHEEYRERETHNFVYLCFSSNNAFILGLIIQIGCLSIHFCTLHNENLFSEILWVFLYTYVYMRNMRKIWFRYTSPETDSYFEISFSSFYGKKKVQAVIPVAVPVNGNESDISDGGDESDGSIESGTEDEIMESETEEDTEESDSSESEEDVATVSATNGRKPQAKGKKANLS